MTRSSFRVALRIAVATLLTVSGALIATPAAHATPSDLFFSEYIEGSSNNKALEIFNGTGTAVPLTSAYTIEFYFNGSGTVGGTIPLTGTVASNDVFVLAQSAANATILAQADQTSAAAFYNGDDAVVLKHNGTIIDVIGQIGLDPGTEWGTGLTSTADDTLRRKCSIEAGDANGADTFDPSIEWDGFPTDDSANLGTHSLCAGDAAPSVASTTPADNATNVPVAQTISVTFSEPVDATSQSFTVTGSGTVNHTFVLSGGPTTWTVDPDSDFAQGETVTVDVNAAFVTDQDASDPPDNMAGNYQFDFTTVPADVAPSVSSTSPTNGAGQQALNSNIAVNFSESVHVTSSWLTISGSSSGAHTYTYDSSPSAQTEATTWVANPDSDFVNGETVTVTVVANQVGDTDVTDPPENMAANYVFSFGTPIRIHDVQGATHISPYAGQTVIGVPGIVTAKRNNGYYLQDDPASYDANDNTSEAIFVFTNSAPTVSAGDSVSVSGTVSEFRAGGAASASLTNTEITTPGLTTIVNSSGNPLPAPTVAGTGGRVPPNGSVEDDATGSVETSGVFDPAQDGIDFWETLEFMRVQLNNAHVVGPTSDFGSNREVPVVGDNGANATILTARGGILLRETDTNGERIILNDVITGGPTLATTVDVGDSYPGQTVGVIDYAFNNFKLEVTSIPPLVSGGLAQETTVNAAPGQLAIGSFNVENLDPGDGAAKFNDLANEIVINMKSPDILAVEELQDNNGPTDNGVVDATTTLNTLVTAIQTAGGPTYSYRLINPVNDQDGGEPGGNIRVAFMFRTDRGVAFVDRPGGTSTSNTTVVNNGGVPELSASPGRLDPTNPAFNASRKPLAGEFTYNGDTVFVVANHWNSKGGDNPLWGRFQPPVLSSEVQRVQQAQIVHDFVDDILAIDADSRIVVLGDLNDFSWSNPLQTLTAGGVLEDLVLTLPEAERYSYVFEGNTQELDHLLGSQQMTADMDLYDPIHANAEFAPQVSDHDPLVALFSFAAPSACSISGTEANDTLTGTPGADHICGFGGDDTITGLSGNDVIEGGNGNDTMRGNGASDVIEGGNGNDTATGGAGNDDLVGDAGNDTMNGGSGADALDGGKGNDALNTVDGVNGNDSIDGGKGSDTCTGDPGDVIQQCP